MGYGHTRECYSYSYSYSTRRVRSNACLKAYALKVANVDRQQKYPDVPLKSRAATLGRTGWKPMSALKIRGPAESEGSLEEYSRAVLA
jgi:hypothetical protein